MIYCKKKSLIKKIKSILKNKGETSLNSSSFIRGFFVFLFLLFLSVYGVYLFLAPKHINEIKKLENVDEVTFNSNLLLVTYKKGKNNLVSIMEYLKKEDIKYNKIYSERPTLNDVFLELTGKELRD